MVPLPSPEAAAPSIDASNGACPIETASLDPGRDVTFDEVVVLLNDHCAGLPCHASARAAGLFLGPHPVEGELDAAARQEIYAGLLTPSTTAPEIARIDPTRPGQSFLMLKLDGCQNEAGLGCPPDSNGETQCGGRMPSNDDALPLEERDLVRTWILQGAPGPG